MTITFPGFYTSGTLAAGAGKATQICNAFEAFITGVVNASGSQMWRVIHTFSAGYHKVFKSVGDPNLRNGIGDTSIVFWLSQSSTTQLNGRSYIDFYPPAASGILQGPSVALSIANASNQMDYWFFANEYACCAILSQSTGHRWWSFGEVYRNHLPWSNRGRAFTTTIAPSGSNVVVSIDRDLTDIYGPFGIITPSQSIDIIDLCNGDAPLYKAERTTVISISSGSITFANLMTSHSLGSIIGLDPLPSGMIVPTNNNTFQFQYLMNLSASSAANLAMTVTSVFNNMGFNDHNPAWDYHQNGVRYGSQYLCYDTINNNSGSRGMLQLETGWWAAGATSSTTFTDINTNRNWIMFPNIGIISWKPGFIITGSI